MEGYKGLRVFVASWFFPPVTTAESIVTFKLLKNSEFHYDVCSSKSQKWSYNKESDFKSPNIHPYIIETDSFDKWIIESVNIFKENHAKQKYDFIMTRIFPPESHYVGLKIKKEFPDIRWVASFGDPLAINPYEMELYVKNKFRGMIGKLLMRHPQKLIPLASKFIPNAGLKILAKNQSLQNKVMKQADYYIFPSLEQCKFSMGKRFDKYADKYLIIPHSYDLSMYRGDASSEKKDKAFVFAYIGHADNLRNPSGFIQALKILREINPELTKKIRLKLVGNYPRWIRNMVYAFFLQDIIEFHEPVDYLESLKIMTESDCLVHIDAFFSFLPGGSIFLASKLIDYLGAQKPILGLTTSNCPAGKLIERFGHLTVPTWEHIGIATAIIKIVNGNVRPNYTDIGTYSAEAIAKIFDKCMIENIPYLPKEPNVVNMEK